jgi:crotonobetainyl-CoA:carnitine CoA-transferase CaiB-like acyl-CoA transferase
MIAFQGMDCCVSSVVTLAEAGEPRPMPWLASTPPESCAAVPWLGEHTREVLEASGFTEDEIHALG